MQTRQTIADQVREKLIDDIVKLRLRPNEKLSEQFLAGRFGTSRAPVHDALAQLEPMGLVRIVPQSGTFVSELSVRRCYDICDVRLQLETYAVRVAAERITREQLDQLQQLFDRLDGMDPAEEETRTFIHEVDAQLHKTIYDACGNALIAEIIHQYLPLIERIRHANMKFSHRQEATLAEMKEIFEALKHRSPEWACKAMETHIRNIRAAIAFPDDRAGA